MRATAATRAKPVRMRDSCNARMTATPMPTARIAPRLPVKISPGTSSTPNGE